LLTNNSQGIIILLSQDVTLKNNSIQDTTYPFFVYGSTMEQYYLDIDLSNTIDGKPIYYLCNITNSTMTGSMAIGFLALIDCTNITIDDYSPARSGIGVLLAGTRSSTLSSCIFQNTDTAVVLFNCSHTVIRNCEIDASVPDPTILIINSPYTVLRNNTIHLLNSGGLYIDGETDEAYYQDIDTSNVINGRPIYYLIGVNNKIFEKSEVGYLALINCHHLFLTNLNISNGCQAMLLVNTKAVITKCKFSGNMYGVSIVGKSPISLYNSQFIGNRFGCVLYNCSETVISQCQFTGSDVGFDINRSHDNIIKKCLIADSKYNGFQIRDSWNNCLCGNNISSNIYGGIDMRGDCWGNELCGNTLSDGDHGILLDNEIPWNPSPPGPHHNNIHHNNFFQLTTGIVLGDFADDNTIRHNDIHGNVCGVFCTGNDTISENSIYQNYYGAIISSCTVNAKRNWWGSADGPSGDGPGNGDSLRSTNATVIFEPWLKHTANTKPTIFQYIMAYLRVRLRPWMLYN
jgi:parallel beta-helix repeat protein